MLLLMNRTVLIISLSFLCLQGSYSVGSQTVCTPCPAGEACAHTDTNQTVTCSPGEYSVGSQTVRHVSPFVFLFSAATALTVDRHSIMCVNRNIRRSTIDCVAIVRREREFGHASTRAKGKFRGVPFPPFVRTLRFSLAGNILPSPSPPPPLPRTSATLPNCKECVVKSLWRAWLRPWSQILVRSLFAFFFSLSTIAEAILGQNILVTSSFSNKL